MSAPTIQALVRLTRAPAALTVPGDACVGAAWSGRRVPRRAMLTGTCLYLAGMALNDVADHERDAAERPERPLPRGEITLAQGWVVVGVLTAAGLLSAASDGRAMAGLVLAGTVWTYDLWAKDAVTGPALMSAARAQDLLMGSGPRREAALPAGVLALYTWGLTLLSRGEVHGSERWQPACALAGTCAAMVAPVMSAHGRRDRAVTSVNAVLLATTVGRAQLRALREPSAQHARLATGAAVRGMTLVQSGLLAARGQTLQAVCIGAGLPLGSRLGRRVSAT